MSVPFKSFFVTRVLMVLFIRVTHLYWIEKGYRRQICCNFHFPPKLYWSYSTPQYVAIFPIEKLPFLFHATYLGVGYLSTFTFIVYLGLRWLLHSTIGHTNALCQGNKQERGGIWEEIPTRSGLSVEGRPRGGGDPMVHAVVWQECRMMAARWCVESEMWRLRKI